MKQKKNCEHCEKEFEGTARAKFCSSTCRHKAWEKSHGLGNTGATQTQSTSTTTATQPKTVRASIPVPTGLDPQSQVIFSMLQKDSDRWEEKYKEEKSESKKIREEKEKLEKELADLKHANEIASMKHTQELDSVRNEKPSGLAGLADHPMVKELMTHLGPPLGELATFGVRKMTGGPPAMLGDAQELDETAQWVQSQSAETQQALRNLIAQLSQLQDEKVIQASIVRLISVLQGNAMNANRGNGQPRTAMNGTGTFG